MSGEAFQYHIQNISVSYQITCGTSQDFFICPVSLRVEVYRKGFVEYVLFHHRTILGYQVEIMSYRMVKRTYNTDLLITHFSSLDIRGLQYIFFLDYTTLKHKHQGGVNLSV